METHLKDPIRQVCEHKKEVFNYDVTEHFQKWIL